MHNIPAMTKQLLVLNVVAFLAMLLLGATGIDLNDILGLHFFLAPDFHIYQLVTYMFMHGGWTHIFFNMFALWMFGTVVENVWGPRKFLFYYISCGIGAGLFQELAQLMQFYFTVSAQDASVGFFDLAAVASQVGGVLNAWTTVGASGAIYAILLAFGMIFPEERIFIFPLPVPIKAKWFVMFYAGIEVFSLLGSTNDNVAHLAHLGGMVFGFFMIRYWRKHPGGGSYGRSQGAQFFDRLRNSWEQRSHRQAQPRNERQSDWEYNARKQAEQEEIDRILDKIRRSGYDSLTAEEKRKLFDSSNKY